MQKSALILLTAFLLFAFSCSKSDTAREPEHPFLFFKQEDIPAIKQKIAGSDWMTRAYEVLIERADEMMAYGPEPYAYFENPDPDYAFVGDGHWTKHGLLGRILEKRVGTLAIAGYLSGKDRYFKKAKEIMLAAAEASDADEWNSHLQQSDGARGYAIGYDLLYPHMTEAERATIREEIEITATLLHEFKGAWSRSLPDVNSQNHTSVHYGALGLCALALGEKPEWQALATDRIRTYIGNFIDDSGYGTEGVDYTNYGLLGVVPYTVALQRSTGEDLLAEQPGIPLVPGQVTWKMMPWGNEVIAMNDNPTTLGSSAGLMYIITRHELKEDLWAWLQIEGDAGAGSFGAGRPGRRGDSRPPIGDGLSLPFILLWGDGDLEPAVPKKLSQAYSSGRVFMRDGWGNPLGSHVSFTSGVDYHGAHNHSDENAFTFNALGEEFAIDPGRFPWNTRSHNAILVNGRGQIKSYGRGRILDYQELGDAVYVKGDAREAYAPAPNFAHKKIKPDSNQLVLSTAQRQLLYARGEQPYLLIVDDVQTTDGAVNEYTWLLHTDTSNNIITLPNEAAARIVGAKHGAFCDVRVLWPRQNLTFGESDLSDAYLPAKKNMSEEARRLSRYYKEIAATTKAKNPHYVTLLMAREKDATPPTIVTEGDAEKMTVRLSFSNGVSDLITITQDGVTFKRGS